MKSTPTKMLLIIWFTDLLVPNQIQIELSSPRIYLVILSQFRNFLSRIIDIHYTKLCEIEILVTLYCFTFSRKFCWTRFHVLHLHHHHRVFMDCPIEYRPPSSRDDGSQCHVFCKNLCQRYTSRPRTTSNITKWEEIDFLEIQ